MRSRAAAPRLRVYPGVDVADLLDQMPGNGCARLNKTLGLILILAWVPGPALDLSVILALLSV